MKVNFGIDEHVRLFNELKKALESAKKEVVALDDPTFANSSKATIMTSYTNVCLPTLELARKILDDAERMDIDTTTLDMGFALVVGPPYQPYTGKLEDHADSIVRQLEAYHHRLSTAVNKDLDRIYPGNSLPNDEA